MASEKRKVLKFTTPVGVAIYPRLNEPDTKFKKEGEYSARLRFGPGEFPPALLEKLEALVEEKREEVLAELRSKKQGAKVKSLSTRPVLTAEVDKETGEETGNFTINPKMRASGVSRKTGKAWTRSPRIFDAKSPNPLKNPPAIWGGSKLKVSGEAMAYYTPLDNEVGVAFYLEAVQIIELVSGKEHSASDYGFGEEDGYTVSETVNDSAAEETAGADASAEDDDF